MPMPIFRVSHQRNAGLLCRLLLCVFCAVSAFAQQPANCPALKQRYSEAIKNRNNAAINRLGQQLNAQGCHNQPKVPAAPPALQYRVGKVQTVAFSPGEPGEGQSTVIPPGTNTDCPAGVLLISDDWQRPPGSVVRARHLSGSKPDIVSTFDLPPHPGNYAYVTNDHDLSDGQLVKLDPSDGTLYLTFRCVGYEGGTNKKGEFKLTNTWLSAGTTKTCSKSHDDGTEHNISLVNEGGGALRPLFKPVQSHRRPTCSISLRLR